MFPFFDQFFVVEKHAKTVIAGERENVWAAVGDGEIGRPADAENASGNAGRGPFVAVEIDFFIRADERGLAFEVGVGEIFGVEAVRGGIAGNGDGRGWDDVAFTRTRNEGNLHLPGARGGGAFVERIQNFDGFQRLDARTAERADLQFVRRFADQGEGFGLLEIQRQDVVLIFQKHDAFGGDFVGEIAVLLGIHERMVLGHGAIEQPDADDGAQNAMHGIVDGRLGDAVIGESGFQLRDVHVVAFGHFQIVAVLNSVRFVHAAPIGHHGAVEAPFVFQNVGEQIMIGAGMVAVHEVVGTHHAPDFGFGDAGFEGGQINFAQGAFADFGIDAVAILFLVVAGEVLDAGGDAGELHAFDVADGQARGEIGVFAEVFAVAAAEGRAMDVHGGPEQHLHAGAFVVSLDSDGAADLRD